MSTSREDVHVTSSYVITSDCYRTSSYVISRQIVI